VFDDLLPLTDTQRDIQQLARAFAAEHVAPFAAAWDRDQHFEPELVPQLGESGFLGMLIPEAYDGLGLDTTSYLLALEEMAAADASTAVMMSVHNSLPTQMLLAHGSEMLKERYLRPMARGEILGGFALSEPDAGSDAASLRTQAVRDGDCWVLNGTKSWVTHGSYDRLAVLTQVRTDTADARRGSRGISTFVLTPDMPGFRVGKKENKLGLRASPTVQLVFEDLRVPADHMVGEEGQGFRYAMQGLDHGRMGIAAQALGISRAAFVAARDYADQRKQFGQPIRNFQAIQFKLADMASRIASARALLFQAAAAKDAGARVTPYSSMAKLLASETAVFVADEAVQIFGGYGYVKEYPVERHLRDAKVTEIYEGTSEIQRVVIARELYT
jgi:alkylation response protein AidB-like acyl-CoA dehydrogenase